MRELIVDDFCGGGGASLGIEQATGRSPDIGVNHDAWAIGMHTTNHPDTKHLCQNIWKVDPDEFDGPIGLLWASPACPHFSKARGGKPVENSSRNLAWVIVRWARRTKGAPRIIIMENVEEWLSWGPLDDGRPRSSEEGRTFKAWVRELRRLGYRVEWKELVAADYGAPTVRKRLFVVARNDGKPIVWPKPTHGKPGLLPVRAGKLKPWRTAAEIIDWSLPCPSIFDTAEEIMEKHGVRAIRPLAPNTLARIARGIRRYVLDAASPFIVPITHTGDKRVHGLDEPFRTVTTAHRGEHALITPYLSTYYGDGEGGNTRGGRADEPLRTQPTENRHALVTPFVTKFNTGSTGRRVDEPLHTITAAHSDTHPGAAAPLGIVIPTLIQTGYGERPGQAPRVPGLDKPMGTAVNGQKHALVAAFLAQHNSERNGGIKSGRDARDPVSTVTSTGGQQCVVAAGLINLKGTDPSQFGPRDLHAPLPTQCAGGGHVGEVRAFLLKYFGTEQDPRLEEPLHTATTKHRFGIVTVHGEPYQIIDIGMRMLTPRELFRAQGFPDSYVIDRMPDGSPITKTHQVRCCGNSVCPPVAAALVAANFQGQDTERRAPMWFFGHPEALS